jgi:hypothetical protein
MINLNHPYIIKYYEVHSELMTGVYIFWEWTVIPFPNVGWVMLKDWKNYLEMPKYLLYINNKCSLWNWQTRGEVMTMLSAYHIFYQWCIYFRAAYPKSYHLAQCGSISWVQNYNFCNTLLNHWRHKFYCFWMQISEARHNNGAIFCTVDICCMFSDQNFHYFCCYKKWITQIYWQRRSISVCWILEQEFLKGYVWRVT